MRRFFLVGALAVLPIPALARAGADMPAQRGQPSKSWQTENLSTEGFRGGPPGFANPNTLNGCMTLWSPQTHVTKHEWRRTCRNSLGKEPTVN